MAYKQVENYETVASLEGSPPNGVASREAIGAVGCIPIETVAGVLVGVNLFLSVDGKNERDVAVAFSRIGYGMGIGVACGIGLTVNVPFKTVACRYGNRLGSGGMANG